MAETTIQWADYTFNPWVGCQRVSPGCEHCYAEAYDKRVGGAPKHLRERDDVPQLRWGPDADRVRTSVALWKQPLKWNLAAKDEQDGANVENGHPPARRRRVFCASLADVFDMHESIDPRWRLELFSLIRQTPHLDWLLLTKRPGNFHLVVQQALSLSARAHDHEAYMGSPEAFEETRLWLHRWASGEAPANVWAGTTVEDRPRMARVARLREIAARVRFLSLEPLLEDLGAIDLKGVDWIIVGGESGGGARRFEVGWAYNLLTRAKRAGVAPFVKQLGAFVVDRNDVGFEAENETWTEGPDAGQPTRPGAWPSPARGVEENINGCREEHQGADVRVRLRDRAGGDPDEWPLALRVRRFPEVRRG